MLRRLPHFLILLWWLAWVAFIVPAHTRGALSVTGDIMLDAGGKPIQFFFASVSSCCCTPTDSTDKPHKPTPAKSCAICQLVMHTVLIGGIEKPTLSPQPTTQTLLCQPESWRSAKLFREYLSTGPPPALFSASV